MQTKVSNNSKRYIYRKNALGRDKSVMGQMTGAVKNYIKQKNEQRRLTAKEYRKTVRPIATKPVVQSMKKFNHHSQTSCFKHSVHVSYMNYIVCKKLGLDDNAAAKAGLLHDLFLYDWHGHKPEKGERMHGFEHPNKALKNAHDNFSLTKKEGDMITKHMFPLTLTPPSYKETYVIVMTDKLCSLSLIHI